MDIKTFKTQLKKAIDRNETLSITLPNRCNVEHQEKVYRGYINQFIYDYNVLGYIYINRRYLQSLKQTDITVLTIGYKSDEV